MIVELINQLPEDEAVLALIADFEKLLRKYANWVKSEDSYEDLRLFFIELIYKMKRRKICMENDGQVVNYINRSIRNEALRLRKRNTLNIPIKLSDLSDEQIVYIEKAMSVENATSLTEYFSNSLSEKEQLIIYMIFENGYSCSKAAEILGITRQAVNQAKIRAIAKIKENIS